MYSIERQNKIIEILQQKKSISVQKLTEMLFISPATARRDLAALEKKGVLKRTFGGAVLTDPNSTEGSIIIRQQMMVKSKRIICEKAAALLRNGNSVFLDSSSTVANIVPFLSDFRYLLLVTNGIHIASQLVNGTGDFRVILIGGEIVTRSNSTIGPTAIQSLGAFHCDICLCSCAGIDIANGVSELDVEQSEIKQMMMARSTVKILLVDCSKFGKTFFSKTCDISDYDVIITDQKSPKEFLDYFNEHDIKLIC